MRRAVGLGLVAGVFVLGLPGATALWTAEATEPRAVPSSAVAAVPLDTDRLLVAEFASTLSLEAKIRQLLMIHCPGQDPAGLAACADSASVGGLILMGDNVPNDPAALAALSAAVSGSAPFERLLAIDQEGGSVSRMPWDTLPAGSELAGLPVSDTAQAFQARAELVRSGGLNVNFGVVADVTADSRSFLYDRVLGHDPLSAAERVSAAVSAEASLGSTLKHFPGHGAAVGDSHSSLPVTGFSLDEWRGSEALPFAAGISAGAELVMMSHVVFSSVEAVPASLSPAWHRLLREELGFAGVIVSDDLLMLQANGIAEFADPYQNAIRALAAGTDVLLFVLPADPSAVGVNIDALVASIAAAVADGRISAVHIDDALERVLSLRLELGRAA